jgi:hypothetical protein
LCRVALTSCPSNEADADELADVLSVLPFSVGGAEGARDVVATKGPLIWPFLAPIPLKLLAVSTSLTSDLPPPSDGVGSSCALHHAIISVSAVSSRGGRPLPRFASRRIIPAQALDERKYLSRDGLVGSKTSDKPHTTSSLGDCERKRLCSGKLCVQNPPGEAVPAFDQRTEEGSEVESATGG